MFKTWQHTHNRCTHKLNFFFHSKIEMFIPVMSVTTELVFPVRIVLKKMKVNVWSVETTTVISNSVSQ